MMKTPGDRASRNIKKTSRNRNGGDTMKTLFGMAFRSAVVLLAALLFLLTPGQVRAQLTPEQVCNSQPADGDYDGDGFLNGEECEGLKLENGATITWPGLHTLNPPANKPALNPAKRDILVVLARTSPSYIPAAPFDYISQPQPYGLATNVYEIPAADVPTVLSADRMVINRGNTFQKAVKMQESLSASSVLGRCDEAWATPNGLDNCFVFTKAIRDFVDATCAGISNKSKCMDSLTQTTPLTTPSIYDIYIKHTLAHECGHDVKLRGIYVSNTGGYHYASTDKVILSQSVYFKAGGSAVTWYIGTRYYSPNDQQDFVLWQP
jgi:hypothetical protein